jgi:hypothetical protein
MLRALVTFTSLHSHWSVWHHALQNVTDVFGDHIWGSGPRLASVVCDGQWLLAQACLEHISVEGDADFGLQLHILKLEEGHAISGSC